MENIKKEGSAYIGDYLGRDLAAFCGGTWYEGIQPGNKDLKIMDKLWSIQNGYFTFCWPGAIVPIDWMVYRGMVGRAIIFNIISCVYFGVAYFISTFLGVMVEYRKSGSVVETEWTILGVFILFWLLYAFLMGIYTIHAYRRNVFRKLEKRGLKNRMDVDSFELKESLRKEGKRSFLRVIVYRVVATLISTCIGGIATTIIYLL